LVHGVSPIATRGGVPRSMAQRAPKANQARTKIRIIGLRDEIDIGPRGGALENLL